MDRKIVRQPIQTWQVVLKMMTDDDYLENIKHLKRISPDWHPEESLKKLILSDSYKTDLVRIIMELESCN